MAPRDEDDDWHGEEIERRRDPRGVFPGLGIALLGPKPATFTAVEASERSFFVQVADPEAYILGDLHEARISHEGIQVACRLTVIRKAIEPRKGIALRVTYIDPTNEAALTQIIGRSSAG